MVGAFVVILGAFFVVGAFVVVVVSFVVGASVGGFVVASVSSGVAWKETDIPDDKGL